MSVKKLGMVHACNPRKLRQEDPEFEASLGYIARLCFKKKGSVKYNYLKMTFFSPPLESSNYHKNTP
jgi:hypothetical protein